MIGVAVMDKKQDSLKDKISVWLRNADYVIIDTENGIRVRTDSGMTLVVNVDSDRNLIKCYCAFSFMLDAKTEDKLELVNTLNKSVVFARFSMPKPETLVSDYFFFTKIPVTKKMFLSSLRFFESVTIRAIDMCDKNDLVT